MHLSANTPVAPPSADVELQLLTIRPWFCEMPGPQGRTETEDLLKCLGEGHVYNQTDVGLCQGRRLYPKLAILPGSPDTPEI